MDKKEKSTFTKSILSIVVFLYFIGATMGTVLVIVAALMDAKLGIPVDSQMFIAYASYLGAPTATAIAFYAWKSKCENLLKIHYTNSKTNDQSNTDTLVQTLANIGGN